MLSRRARPLRQRSRSTNEARPLAHETHLGQQAKHFDAILRVARARSRLTLFFSVRAALCARFCILHSLRTAGKRRAGLALTLCPPARSPHSRHCHHLGQFRFLVRAVYAVAICLEKTCYSNICTTLKLCHHFLSLTPRRQSLACRRASPCAPAIARSPNPRCACVPGPSACPLSNAHMLFTYSPPPPCPFQCASADGTMHLVRRDQLQRL